MFVLVATFARVTYFCKAGKSIEHGTARDKRKKKKRDNSVVVRLKKTL